MSTLVLPGQAAGAPSHASNALPAYVRPYFADSRPIDVGLFEDHARGGDIRTLLGRGGGGADDDARVIGPSSLEGAASGWGVETFLLVRLSSTNGHKGVFAYHDKVGLLKRLPLNHRASSLAARCRYLPAPNFYGDVFVGTTRSVPPAPRRNVHMTREDVMDATRGWIVRAPGENAAWQRGIDRSSGWGSNPPSSTSGARGALVGPDGSPAGGGATARAGASPRRRDSSPNDNQPGRRGRGGVEEGARPAQTV